MKCKRVLSWILTLIMVTGMLLVSVSAEEDITVLLDGEKFVLDVPSCNELEIYYYNGGEFPDPDDTLYYCYKTTDVDEIKDILNGLKNMNLVSFDGGGGGVGGEHLTIYADGKEVISFMMSASGYNLCRTPDKFYFYSLEECRKLEEIILKYKHESDIKIYYDNESMYFYSSPVIIDERTLVPIGEIEEKFGISASASKEEAYIGNSEKELRFLMDEKIVYENGVMQPIDVGCVMINRIAMVPLRKVAEYLGYTVKWENDSVYIISK